MSESEAVDFYRKELTRLGWKEVKTRGRGNYQFLRNATHLNIEIQQDVEGRTAVGISSGLFSAD